MAAAGALTPEQLREALAERLALSIADAAPFLAPHFVEMVLAVGRRRRGPSRIETTLDLELQREVEGIIEQQRRVAARARRRERRGGRARQRDAANGWRGKARATTSTPSTAARSTVRSCRGSRAPRSSRSPTRWRSRRGARPRPCWPTSRRTFRPPSPACSTARATTTASIAVRCWRGARWPAPRTCRPSRSRPRSASARCCGS